MGTKDVPCEHPPPAKTSAPAPSAFIFPPRRSPSPTKPSAASRRMTFALAAATFTLPRPRSHFLRIVFGDAHEDFGIPQQQLSTMGYPRKSYPHRCPPPCAKRSRPRACARVYIIYRSPVGRSRGGFAPLRKRVRAVVAPCPAPPCAGWGEGEGKGGRPLAQCRTMPLVCRITVCKGGSAQGQPRPCPCALPAATCLLPRPRPLMGELPCAKAEVHRANPAPARVLSPRQLAYCLAPAR